MRRAATTVLWIMPTYISDVFGSATRRLNFAHRHQHFGHWFRAPTKLLRHTTHSHSVGQSRIIYLYSHSSLLSRLYCVLWLRFFPRNIWKRRRKRICGFCSSHSIHTVFFVPSFSHLLLLLFIIIGHIRVFFSSRRQFLAGLEAMIFSVEFFKSWNEK